MKFLDIVKKIGTLSLTIYLVLFAAFALLIDKDKIAMAKLHVLNRVAPQPDSYNYLLAVPQQDKAYRIRKLRPYIFYYRTATEIMPNRADAYGMLGFCHFYSGNFKKSAQAFEKARAINPYYFWFDYNLAVIYFQEEEYKKAIQYFNQAINAKPALTFKFVEISKIYRPLLKYSDNVERMLKNNLRIGFLNSHKLLVLSHYNSEDYAKAIEVAVRSANLQIGDQDFFHYYAGLSAYKLKDYQKAAYYFLEAINKNPRFIKAYQYLGLTWRALGREDMSRKAEQTAQRLKRVAKESIDKVPMKVQIY